MIALALLLAAAAPSADPVIGQWRNPAGSVTVATRHCGPALCGRVVAATPDAIARARNAGVERLVGTELFRDYRANGPGSWSGTLFVPDQGAEVESELHLLDRNTIEVSGCLAAGFLCKTQAWTRVARTR